MNHISPILHALSGASCLFAATLPAQSVLCEPNSLALSTRYAPYADLSSFDFDSPQESAAKAWWSTPVEIRADRAKGAGESPPLAGLHLALDPGHIGGIWAEWEGRHFRIGNEDHWVREGELVLEVAQRVRAQLVELGAEVSLLRESADPVNPKEPVDYWSQAAADLEPPKAITLAAQVDHALAVRDRAVKLAIVIGELAERARLVNEVIRPDALISLHINAAPWPEEGMRRLVESNHAHVLIFGCMTAGELASTAQRARLVEKLKNGSGPIEVELGAALGQALAEATGLPASEYNGRNAVRIDPEVPHLWARNLMLLRLVDCPTVLLEPHIANSLTGYAHLQAALAVRAEGTPIPSDDILVEYANAVVAGVLRVYGPE